jgi:inner membrane protein
MDSLTQFVLGASFAAAVVPARHARRAMLYGAALGTLPDLDTFVPFSDPLDSLILHRSASHSLLVLPLLALLLYWIAQRFDTQLRDLPGRWRWAFVLALVTHPLLDSLTIYGTQLLWPLTNYPFGTGSVFIVDPMVTVPLLIAFVWVLLKPAISQRAHALALGAAIAYLGLGFATQQIVQSRIDADASTEGKAKVVSAAPLTVLLQRAVVRDENSYREAYVSIFDGNTPIVWSSFASDYAALAPLQHDRNVQRLQAFSKDMIGVKRVGENLHVFDLRMGSEPGYVFNFDFGPVDALAKQPSGSTKQVIQLPSQRPGTRALPWLWQRTFNPAHSLPPPHEVNASESRK